MFQSEQANDAHRKSPISATSAWTRPTPLFLQLVAFGIVLVLAISAGHAQQVPILNAGGSDSDLSTLRPLSGRWAFWWGRFVDPTSEILPEPDGYISIPGVWNDWHPDSDDNGVGARGHASYALVVRLPPDVQEVSLFVPPASTAYRLYANGTLIAHSGSPGRTQAETLPRYRIRTVRIQPDSRSIQLVAHVANFHHRRGGLWEPIMLGAPEQLEAWITLEMLYDLLLAGGLILMGFYLLALHLSGPKPIDQSTALFAAVFLLSLAARILVTGQMVAARAVPSLSWGLQLRIEYLSAHVALFSFVWIFHSAFPNHIPRWSVLGVSAYAASNALASLVLPLYMYSQWIPLYALSMNAVFLAVAVMLAVATVQRKPEALSYLGGALLALLSATGEALQISPMLASREMVPLSMLLRLAFGNRLGEYALQAVSIGGSLLLVFVAAALIVLHTSRRLISQLRTASSKEGSSAPTLRPHLITSPVAQQRAAEYLTATHGVTPREFEIAGLVAQGLSNKEIADQLFLSIPTVKTHLYNLMRKADVKNRHELTMLYLGALETNKE